MVQWHLRIWSSKGNCCIAVTLVALNPPYISEIHKLCTFLTLYCAIHRELHGLFISLKASCLSQLRPWRIWVRRRRRLRRYVQPNLRVEVDLCVYGFTCSLLGACNLRFVTVFYYNIKVITASILELSCILPLVTNRGGPGGGYTGGSMKLPILLFRLSIYFFPSTSYIVFFSNSFPCDCACFIEFLALLHSFTYRKWNGHIAHQFRSRSDVSHKCDLILIFHMNSISF